jgi:hypothetical protein
MKYLYEIFNIKEGVLRCGDDIIFSEEKLIEFLNSDKYNYYGQYPCELNTYIAPLNLIKNILMIIII